MNLINLHDNRQNFSVHKLPIINQWRIMEISRYFLSIYIVTFKNRHRDVEILVVKVGVLGGNRINALMRFPPSRINALIFLAPPARPARCTAVHLKRLCHQKAYRQERVIRREPKGKS
jgi:hypothetical protein